MFNFSHSLLLAPEGVQCVYKIVSILIVATKSDSIFGSNVHILCLPNTKILILLLPNAKKRLI